jgi:hypothetical protein
MTSIQSFFSHPSIRFENPHGIVDFFKEFLGPHKVWTLQEFMHDLDTMYELTRVRFTKGGHKINQD